MSSNVQRTVSGLFNKCAGPYKDKLGEFLPDQFTCHVPVPTLDKWELTLRRVPENGPQAEGSEISHLTKDEIQLVQERLQEQQMRELLSCDLARHGPCETVLIDSGSDIDEGPPKAKGVSTEEKRKVGRIWKGVESIRSKVRPHRAPDHAKTSKRKVTDACLEVDKQNAEDLSGRSSLAARKLPTENCHTIPSLNLRASAARCTSMGRPVRGPDGQEEVPRPDLQRLEKIESFQDSEATAIEDHAEVMLGSRESMRGVRFDHRTPILPAAPAKEKFVGKVSVSTATGSPSRSYFMGTGSRQIPTPQTQTPIHHRTPSCRPDLAGSMRITANQGGGYHTMPSMSSPTGGLLPQMPYHLKVSETTRTTELGRIDQRDKMGVGRTSLCQKRGEELAVQEAQMAAEERVEERKRVGGSQRGDLRKGAGNEERAGEKRKAADMVSRAPPTLKCLESQMYSLSSCGSIAADLPKSNALVDDLGPIHRCPTTLLDLVDFVYESLSGKVWLFRPEQVDLCLVPCKIIASESHHENQSRGSRYLLGDSYWELKRDMKRGSVLGCWRAKYYVRAPSEAAALTIVAGRPTPYERSLPVIQQTKMHVAKLGTMRATPQLTEIISEDNLSKGSLVKNVILGSYDEMSRLHCTDAQDWNSVVVFVDSVAILLAAKDLTAGQKARIAPSSLAQQIVAELYSTSPSPLSPIESSRSQPDNFIWIPESDLAPPQMEQSPSPNCRETLTPKLLKECHASNGDASNSEELRADAPAVRRLCAEKSQPVSTVALQPDSLTNQNCALQTAATCQTKSMTSNSASSHCAPSSGSAPSSAVPLVAAPDLDNRGKTALESVFQAGPMNIVSPWSNNSLQIRGLLRNDGCSGDPCPGPVKQPAYQPVTESCADIAKHQQDAVDLESISVTDSLKTDCISRSVDEVAPTQDSVEGAGDRKSNVRDSRPLATEGPELEDFVDAEESKSEAKETVSLPEPVNVVEWTQVSSMVSSSARTLAMYKKNKQYLPQRVALSQLERLVKSAQKLILQGPVPDPLRSDAHRFLLDLAVEVDECCSEPAHEEIASVVALLLQNVS